MPDPTTTTYLGIPGFVYLWAITLVVGVIFGRRAYMILTTVGRGRAEPRWDQAPRRLWNVVVNVAGQRRMFDNLGMGLAHLIIFWTFIFYAGSFAWNLLRGLFPFLPIPYADEVPWITFPMELLSVATLVALAGVAVRRFAFPPPRLTLSRDAGFILVLIALLMVTFLVGQGAKAAAEPEAVSGSPIGELIGSWLGGISTATAESLYLSMWWVHMLAVLGFLAYLPYSKHLHLLASPFNVFTASLDPGDDAAAIRGSRTTGGLHLAGVVQRPRLCRVWSLRPGLSGVRLRCGCSRPGTLSMTSGGWSSLRRTVTGRGVSSIR